MKIIHKDVLIIGAGLAGLYVALNLDENLDVLVLSKSTMTQSNSLLAQGGIAACLNDNDSFSSHIQDTLKAGSNINVVDAVQTLVTNAPQAIENLIDYGVDFDKDASGNLLSTLEGGHSKKRVLHANGDATGKIIMDALLNHVKNQKNLSFLENTMAIELIKYNNQIIGAVIIKDHEMMLIHAKSIIIASGGIGALFEKTTNESFATGDGIALANKVNAKLNNLCFIQFHPTAYHSNNEDRTFLISEAVRGEGAYLLNNKQERFMPNYHEDAELAPRDVVSQSIISEMKSTDSDYVYLDIRHKEEDFLKNRFPTIFNYLKADGINMSKDLIKVSPVAHYFVGGISTDLYGQTNINYLYACGEVASTGVHGANRLASNSLLECIVFGKRIASHINENIQNNYNFNEEISVIFEQYANYYKNKKIIFETKLDLKMLKVKIKRIMSQSVGIIRNKEGLLNAKNEIAAIYNYLNTIYLKDINFYETKNMALVANLIIDNALLLNKSIGCHYREN